MLFCSVLVFPTSHTFIVLGTITHKHLNWYVWHVGSQTERSFKNTGQILGFNSVFIQSDTKKYFMVSVHQVVHRNGWRCGNSFSTSGSWGTSDCHLVNWSVGIWYHHIWSCNSEKRMAVKWFSHCIHQRTSLTGSVLWIHFSFFAASPFHRAEQTRGVSASNVHTENGGPVRLRSQGEFSKYWCRGTGLWVQLPTRFSLTHALFVEMSLFLLLWWITQVVFFYQCREPVVV